MLQGVANGGRRPLFFTPPPSSREGASLGEAIYEAFVVTGSPAQRHVVGRVGALVGSILGTGIALSLATSGEVSGSDAGAIAAALAGVVAGQVLLRRSVLPMAAFDSMLVLADVVLAIGAVESLHLHRLLPAIYVCLSTAVFLIRPLRSSLAHLGAICASHAYVLAQGPSAPAPLTRLVIVAAAVLISGLFLRWLVGRVTELATVEHATRHEIELTTIELQQQSEAKTAFLGRMSHELRTPLNVVVGFADVLRDGLAGPLSERQSSHVDDIAGSGRDLLRLVDELLDISKVEAGSIDLDLTRVDIAEAVVDAEVLVQGRAREAGVVIHVRRPVGQVVAEADALRIRQVAWNLLGNAVKYTPRGGTVEVLVAEEDDRVRVSVRDPGPGIAPEDHERIFHKFEQGTDPAEGSGIGLAVCRELIEAHGGRLRVDSAPGAGSTFSFDLPRRRRSSAGEVDVPVPAEPVAWTELDQAILVPGSFANRVAMAHVGRWFANSATLLLPICALITPGPIWVRAAVFGTGLVAWLASVTMAREMGAMPLRTVDFLGAFGTIAVSVAMLLGEPFDDLIALAYGWDVLATAALLSAGRVLSQISMVLVCHAIVLALLDAPGAVDRWIGIAMLVCVNGVVVSWVSGRLREVITESLGARLAAEGARAQVEVVSAHKSDFLANISHELCTPLNAVIGFTQVLQDPRTGPLNQKQAEYLDDILDSGQQLLALITDLLDLAKLEAGRLPRSPQPTELAMLIRNAVTELTPGAARRGIRVEVEAPADLPTVEADPTHVYHALTNLLANGIKFTSDGGRVDVLARDVGGRVLVSVRDTGIGILPEQRAHLFEAFHQGTRPLPAHARGGTGLGLTLARGLIELEGGEITLESTPDVGSTFTISLPVRQPANAPAGVP
ncbi:MAG TPA: HAMP domain-containing sensor histidine kinase [Acidimicrobiales bacterium]|nr:HAMP domain-containing sensor histidine kinase [Acidimicrobiales bacterium]